jgi:two-component system, chemotaxis family, sensor kinase CheA
MASKSKTIAVPDEFKGLAELMGKTQGEDKEAIVKVGIRLEQGWTTLRVAGADKTLLGLLKKTLTALQTIYQDQFSDPAAVWNVITLAIQAVQDVLEGKDGAEDELAAAADSLKMLMESDGEVAGVKADQPAQAEGTTDLAETPDSPQDILSAIEGVSAKLMGLIPADTDDLAALRDELVQIASDPRTAGAAVGHLTLSAQQIEALLQGQADAPDKALQAVSQTLGIAADVQEKAQETGSAEEPAEDPQAEPSDESAAPEEEDAPAEEKPTPDAAPAQEKKPAADIDFPGPAVMPEDADTDLLNEYIVESTDHITNAEGALLELESNFEDREKIDVVFRAYHTIKGTSGFLGFDRIQKLAHLAENMLDRAREGQIRIMGGYADLCLRSCDSLRTMIEALHGIEPGQPLTVPDDLTELLEYLCDPEANGFSEAGTEDADMRVGDILVAKGKAKRRDVEKINKAKGEKRIGEAMVETGAAKASDVADAIRTQKQIKQGQSAGIESSIRVSTGRLDSLINMVGELVIAQSMVAQDPSVSAAGSQRLSRSVGHAGKIIRELQDLTMSLRMVPLKGIFQKMNRLVRDLARKSGKKVQFITEGEDTEIDRNMVESLNDPLVHMIRNSVDHGVESPEDRLAKGKDETGTVWLRAYHSAGNVVIELEDDGKGLDRDRILAKAQERGVLEKNREMSDPEVFGLIFAAGFSTAEKVTDVSGRGVGMDVVKRNIESLRGRIEVNSKQNVGTTFSVRLPLTMAITDAMILRVGQERYLLPTVSIEQSFQPEQGSVSTVAGQGEMVMLRGELLPLFRLHEMFGVSGAKTDPYEGLLVVIEGDGKRCALMVDELLGQQQVVIKSLGEGMTRVAGVSGGAILGDGCVGLILDATGLLQLAQGQAQLAPV